MTRHNDSTNRTSRDEAIRSRLLNRLGIHKTTALSMSAPEASSIVLYSRPDVPVFRESLNDSHEEHSRRPHHVRRPSRKRLVRFDSAVMVKPIASHTTYSKRIKRTIWTDAQELQDNAYRNQVEFQAEGWDYNKVLEEEDMYVHATTGEFVHPYWIENDN
mmetsp:Transcript_23228/g.37785  ORF Transcript_23228/g.37785 Transcript_23228/m.37785 type:complete len:160 (+) Transcript_23228:240-719(+)|eukprot:CAMPEP_0178744162 /NCGR_PEP_ID=MMETSP0744-20121128/6612_1 /TAXON_ID=913974 /ORGANISM="Nitzschia punctata, Strain CCMP561" /LENGTH=159 /DNA_ID=CAMNT_0020397255 /DNA_START=96 /DNA_END=575 /DNA_ORIENTATION=+